MTTLFLTIPLEGTLVMINIEDNKKYYEEIEKMYDRIANSEDAAIRNQAVSMLMSKGSVAKFSKKSILV